MRRIEFDPPATLSEEDKTWWKDWSAKANTALLAYIAAWEDWAMARQNDPAAAAEKPPKFNEAIWTQFKLRLLKGVFRNKCAYCETAAPARWPVQVEHFRPKGAVEYRIEGDKALQQAKTLDLNGNEIDHPGYFWLVYDWRNLLPCCSRCNSAKGKNTQFPVGKPYVFLRKLGPADGEEYARAIPSPNWKGMYYPAPEDLDRLEYPLLINPRVHKPSEHITFGTSGIGTGITPEGVGSMKVFDLHDEDLRQERQKAQEAGFAGYMNLIMSYTIQGETLKNSRELALKKLDDLRPTMEYSAAVFDGLPIYWKQMAPQED